MIATAGAPVSIPEPAAPGCHGLRGSIGLTLGQSWLNGSAIDDDHDDSYGSALVELRLGMDFGPNWYGQLDVLGEFTNGDVDDDETYENGDGAAFHLMHKDSSIGVFAGWFEVDLDDSSDYAERYIAGVEGVFSASDIDFQWQIGGVFGERDDSRDGNQSLHDAYFGRLTASKDLGRGWRVGGDAVVAIGEMDENDNDIVIYGWGVQVEKHLNPNWTLALIYNGTYYDQDGGDGEAVDHFVGLNSTFYFGAGSDVEECRPTLGLPPIMRWLGITGGMDES